jgi:CubicO group peptidase (beta-lactamase class C family)
MDSHGAAAMPGTANRCNYPYAQPEAPASATQFLESGARMTFTKMLRKNLFLLGIVLSAPGLYGQPGPIDLQRVQWAAGWVDRFVNDALVQTGVPGAAVAVVYRDKVVLLRGYGVRKAGESGIVNSDTIFQIGNLSEPISTTSLAAIMDNGYVTWDDMIQHLDPEFQFSDEYVTSNATIRDLLSHRSGLPPGSGNLLHDLGYDQATILSRLRFLPLYGFRDLMDDADFGFTEGALAVARQYGDTWENLVQAELFQPLGMRSSSTEYMLHFNAANRAALHVPVDGVMTARYQFNTDAASPAAGVSSTARDLSRWLLLQLNRGMYEGRRIIPESEFSELYAPRMLTGFDTEGLPQFSGLGWKIDYPGGRRRVWQTGDLSRGGSSSVAIHPDDQVGLVVLTNAAATGLSQAAVGLFFDILYNGTSPIGMPSRDWLAYEAELVKAREDDEARRITDFDKLPKPRPNRLMPPSLPLDRYVGTYHSDYFGDLRIEVTPAGLAMVLGRHQTVYLLKHWNADTFTYFFDGASQPPGRRGVVFATSNNAVRFLRVDNFSAVEGDGTFQSVTDTSEDAGAEPRRRAATPVIGLQRSH